MPIDLADYWLDFFGAMFVVSGGGRVLLERVTGSARTLERSDRGIVSEV